MSDLGPESRKLFQKGRADFEPTTVERRRVDRAIARRLGLAAGALVSVPKAASASLGGSGVAAAAASSASLAPAGSALLVVTKWVGAALLASTVGVSAYHAVRAPTPGPSARAVPPATQLEPSAAHAVASAQAPSSPNPSEATSEPASPIASVPVESLPLAPDPTARPSVPAATQKSAGRTAPSIAEETRLVRGAGEALRSGNPGEALALLDEHARNFPNGIMREERIAERVSALCTLGRRSEAKDEVNRFLRSNPDSPLAASLASSCGGASANQPTTEGRAPATNE